MRRAWVFGVIVVVATACSSSATSPAGSSDGGARDATSNADGATPGDAAGASDAAGGEDAAGDAGVVDSGLACDLAFYASDYEPSCQPLLDKYCCTQEQACGADAACNAYVACVNACPPPRDQACLSACGTSVPAPLDAIAQCTKTPPYTVPTGLNCSWPQ